MEDFERYGDYNEYEEDIPKSKNPVLILLKVLVGVICVGVVGLILFRLLVFNHYPDSMKNIYFNETLTEYYEQTNGISVLQHRSCELLTMILTLLISSAISL